MATEAATFGATDREAIVKRLDEGGTAQAYVERSIHPRLLQDDPTRYRKRLETDARYELARLLVETLPEWIGPEGTGPLLLRVTRHEAGGDNDDWDQRRDRSEWALERRDLARRWHSILMRHELTLKRVDQTTLRREVAAALRKQQRTGKPLSGTCAFCTGPLFGRPVNVLRYPPLRPSTKSDAELLLDDISLHYVQVCSEECAELLATEERESDGG